MRKRHNTGPWITSVKRSTLKAKVAKHYKAHFNGYANGSATYSSISDSSTIEWAVLLIETLYPAAVRLDDGN